MLKKILLPFAIVLGLSQAATAQVNLIRLGVNSAILARRLSKGNAPEAAPKPEKPEKPAEAAATQAAVLSAAPAELSMQRTAAAKLPKQAAEQITSLETQLEQCHAAMLASPTAVVCTPEQRLAIQNAAVSVARAKPSWNLQPYQQEMAYYLAEDVRRQQAATPPAPAK